MEGSTARVELSRLVVVRVQGLDVARLDEVCAAAHLGVPLERLVFDFVGDDGFHIAANDRPGVAGPDLATGYVCVATRDLLWQPSPARPCYWRVKGVERAIAVRARATAP
ncbi:MAG TPA: hypothetical protein VIY73_19215 [Polyangiaceae bacterium]